MPSISYDYTGEDEFDQTLMKDKHTDFSTMHRNSEIFLPHELSLLLNPPAGVKGLDKMKSVFIPKKKLM